MQRCEQKLSQETAMRENHASRRKAAENIEAIVALPFLTDRLFVNARTAIKIENGGTQRDDAADDEEIAGMRGGQERDTQKAEDDGRPRTPPQAINRQEQRKKEIRVLHERVIIAECP